MDAGRTKNEIQLDCLQKIMIGAFENIEKSLKCIDDKMDVGMEFGLLWD